MALTSERPSFDHSAMRESLVKIAKSFARSRPIGLALRKRFPSLGAKLDRDLREALEKWENKRAKRLLAWGADPSMIVFTDHNMDACARAARLGNSELILWLCAAGADPNRASYKSWTAMHHASVKGHGLAIIALAAAGADHLALVDTGWPPLLIAARENRLDAVESLCRLGADLDLRDSRGETAFMLCCRRGYEEAARMLLRHGARIDCVERRGFQAIHLAASEGHDGICAMLLEAGADSEEPGPWNKSPLGIARAEGHASTLSLLERHAFAKAHADKDGEEGKASSKSNARRL